MAIIEVKNVGYTYPLRDGARLRAIKNLSFSIERGEFVAVLGMNGSGKSTLAKLLNGLFEPDSGQILIDGLDSKDQKNTFEIRKRVGMVFQNPDNQTVATIVEDDIAFGPENLGIAREEIALRVDEALVAVNMTEFKGRTASRLSGGQKQRVAIAGVLAMRPEILILDEATSMLDPIGRGEVLSVVKELNGQGITVIDITHSMEEAALADRIIVLRKGRLAIDGAPREVFSSKLLEVCGLTLPGVTELAKRLGARGFELGTVMTEDEFTEGICRQLK